jgi:hypothetical protein
VDAFIVKRNIQREIQSVAEETLSQGRAELDAQYFLDLSDDAVPALVTAYQTQSLPDPVREKVGASLACIRYMRDLDERMLPWQSFHFSRFNADRALAEIKGELDTYKITDADLPVMVETPHGEEFSCWQYYYD